MLRQPGFALLGLGQPRGIRHHDRERAAGVGGNLNRHGAKLILAAVGSQQHFERHGAAGPRARIVDPGALNRRGPRLLRRGDGQIEPFDLRALVVAGDDGRQRGDDVGGRAHRRRVAGEEIVERDRSVVADHGRALHGERGGAVLPFVGRKGIEQRGMRHQRPEELIPDHTEAEGAARAAFWLEPQRDGHQLRAWAQSSRDGRRTVLQKRADDLTRRRQLGRGEQARQDRVDVGPRHRKLRRSDVVQGVAEGIHAIAVDMRDGSRAAEEKVAVDEGDPDGIAGLERAVERHVAGTRPYRGTRRHEALLTKGPSEQVAHARIESRHDERRRDGP